MYKRQDLDDYAIAGAEDCISKGHKKNIGLAEDDKMCIRDRKQYWFKLDTGFFRAWSGSVFTRKKGAPYNMAILQIRQFDVIFIKYPA